MQIKRYFDTLFCMFNKKFSKEPTEKQKIGQIGEDCACRYLVERGFKIIERNYLKKWGEIDIIAKKKKKIHFVEVKAVSRDLSEGNVIRETSKGILASVIDTLRGGRQNKQGSEQEHVDENIFLSDKEIPKNNDSYRAEDNMHPWKLQRLGRAV